MFADLAAMMFQKFLGPIATRRKNGPMFPELARRTRSLSIPSRHGSAPATLYLPESTTLLPPVHINFHGGGYVMGQPEQDDGLCAFLAEHAQVCVLNVDYALAPQNRFPIAVEQCFDVVQWAANQGAAQGWNGARLTVGGQSAGGGLATAVAMQALEAGTPQIGLQVLQYPPLDLVTEPAKKLAKAERPVITPFLSHVFNGAYVPNLVQRRHRLASPAWGRNAQGLAGIAPAVIITAGLDRLALESEIYAKQLLEQGALCEHIVLEDVDHAWDLRARDQALIASVYTRIAKHIREVDNRP